MLLRLIAAKKLFYLTIFALVLFSVFFAVQKHPLVDFWFGMALVNLLLIVLGCLFDHNFLPRLKLDLRSQVSKKIFLGSLSAIILYLIFFAGNYLSRLILPFAANDIHTVYALKDNVSLLKMVLLISFIIAPGEELFWRCFLQENLSKHWGKWASWLIAVLLYAGVHLTMGNFMLLAAAAVCGLFWGLLYLRYRSPLLNIISHTLWDLLVFLIIPFSR